MIDINTIFKVVLEIVLCLISIAAYAFLVGSILPLMLRFRCRATDRGLNKYTYPGGRGILYEPHPMHRGHVSSYMLFVCDGVKYVRCKVTDKVDRMSYTVVAFDRHNNVTGVIRTEDKIGPSGCTRRVALPKETSYITLMLDSVNGQKQENPTHLTFDKKRAIVFAVSVIALTVAEALVIRAVVLDCVNFIRVALLGIGGVRIGLLPVLVISAAIATLGLWSMFLKKRKGGLRIK